ncbi:hypothetical protein [Aliidiomarina maris]|nr:hypothetical protein [Aliidiomarina maris]MCL5049899.1 hypothetical protein [Bacillota bacterium]
MLKHNLAIPIIAVLAVLALLTLAWLPAQTGNVQQRPWVDLELSFDASNRHLQPLATDLRYRMNTHHTYRLLNENSQVPQGHTIHVIRIELSQQDDMLWLRANAAGQAIEVNGPISAASSLSSKLFSLINQTLAQA